MSETRKEVSAEQKEYIEKRQKVQRDRPRRRSMEMNIKCYNFDDEQKSCEKEKIVKVGKLNVTCSDTRKTDEVDSVKKVSFIQLLLITLFKGNSI